MNLCASAACASDGGWSRIVAVQIAKAAGARVIGTVSNASKAAVIKEYGADDAIDYVANVPGEIGYRQS
jgi:NADPH-dependent curcumin reductase CurA